MPGNEAGEAYVKLSECHLKLDSKHEAASALVDASNAFKKTNKRGAWRTASRTREAVRSALGTVASFIRARHSPRAESANCLNKAAEYFTDLGRLSIAAKHFKVRAVALQRACAWRAARNVQSARPHAPTAQDMGEIFEEQGDVEEAISFYEKAADLYSGEEVTSTSNNCKLKVAQLSAQTEDYTKAVQLFTEVALSSLDSNLLKYSVKGYLLCAGLCVLCSGDGVAIANAIDKYVDLDATFEDTREHKLLVDLAGAMESGDVDQFTAVVQEFDSMSRLDQWKTTLLLRAKKRCASRETAGGDDDDLT